METPTGFPYLTNSRRVLRRWPRLVHFGPSDLVIVQMQHQKQRARENYPPPSQAEINKEAGTVLQQSKAYRERLLRDAGRNKSRDKKNEETYLAYCKT